MKSVLIKSKARLESEIVSLCKRERELRSVQKSTEDALSGIKTRLGVLMDANGTDSFRVNGFNVVRSEQSRENVKVKELREAFGSVVEKYVHCTTFKVFKVTEEVAATSAMKEAA